MRTLAKIPKISRKFLRVFTIIYNTNNINISHNIEKTQRLKEP